MPRSQKEMRVKNSVTISFVVPRNCKYAERQKLPKLKIILKKNQNNEEWQEKNFNAEQKLENKENQAIERKIQNAKKPEEGQFQN